MSANTGPHRLIWIVGDRILAEERWKAIVGEGDLIRLDGKKLDIAAFAGEIDTLPMFSPHKWILVQDFKLPEKRTEASGPKEPVEGDKRLYDALRRVGEACTVIFVSDVGDKRTRLTKLFIEQGEYIELPSFKDYEIQKMADWVKARMLANGKRISQDRALELVDSVGSDIGQLASEADKLCLAMGDDASVTDVHMEVVAGTPITLRRLIEEGIVQRQPARAQALLRQTLSSNEAPLKILNFIIPRVRNLLQARLCPEGRRDSAAASALFGNMHPFRLKTLYEEADRFSARELRDAIHSLVLADTCLKSSADPKHILSLLVAALCGSIPHASFARAVASTVEPWD